jgi:hypothetical protein
VSLLKNNRDQGASLFFLGLGIAITLASLRYQFGSISKPGPGFIGLWAGVAISFLAAIGFFANWKKKKESEGEYFLGPFWYKALVILLSMVAYAFLIEFLGFLICTFLFMFVLLKIIGAHNWKVVFSGSLVTAIVAYLIFHVWLKTQLPMGILRYLVY